MNRFAKPCMILLILCLITGCAYFQKKDVPPPLPPIEEPKPPFTMKSDYFKAFPWDKLGKPTKDGNEPDTYVHTLKEGEDLKSVALKQMGDPGAERELATYNQYSSPADAKPGDKIVIPYPIIGMSTQLLVKRKGQKRFGDPQPMDTELKKGDEYKIQLEPNVQGYCYVFRQGLKEVTMLYPAKTKLPKTKRNKQAEPLPRDVGQVKAHEIITIPIGTAGFRWDHTKVADKLYVFLSLKPIGDLDDLKGKAKITQVNIDDVMHRVKEGEIYSDRPYTLLRISDPSEILGFYVPLSG